MDAKVDERISLIFRDEDHLYAHCLFYILTIYCKCPLFQFLGCGIHMQITILPGAQKVHISG